MKEYLTPVSPLNVKLSKGLLRERQIVNREITVPYILNKCLETGRISALLHQWDGSEENRPHPFWDSDIGKTVEAIAYSLMDQRDESLESKVDKIVSMLGNAQEDDGYLKSYFQTCEPKEARWSNLYYMHELYCMGHLIEGAVAYYKATGKDQFLKIMCRYADLACREFLPGGKHFGGYCGHPEIETALIRLYEVTGENRYLELSKTFLDQRGRQPWYFEQESLKRGIDTSKTEKQKRHLKYFLPQKGPYAVYQAHIPVKQQFEPVGHAVRAMYLLEGMADTAVKSDDKELLVAAQKVWRHMATTQVTLTGGIGVASDGERFTFDYDIPNEYTYNETCASVALMMAGMRLLQAEPDGVIVDLIERSLYNTVLAAVSLSGDRFLYANYLDVYPERFRQASLAMIDKQAAERQPWFNVACCPPNLSRLLGSLGQYVASSRAEEEIYIHLLTGCMIDTGFASYRVDTEYPLNGEVSITCEKAWSGKLSVHIPGWCDKWTAEINGASIQPELQKGYASVNRSWEIGDILTLHLMIEPVIVESNPRVREDAGKLAIMRGPLVYCLEEKDNGNNLHDVTVDPNRAGMKEAIEELNGTEIVSLLIHGYRRNSHPWPEGELYRPIRSVTKSVTLKAVPYYVWGNRGFSEMLVWIHRNGV